MGDIIIRQRPRTLRSLAKGTIMAANLGEGNDPKAPRNGLIDAESTGLSTRAKVGLSAVGSIGSIWALTAMPKPAKVIVGALGLVGGYAARAWQVGTPNPRAVFSRQTRTS